MSLKNRMDHELGTDVQVHAGGPGSLDVYVDGDRIYSKKETGQMPSAEELLALIRARQGPAAK